MATGPPHFDSFEILETEKGEPWILGQGSFGTTYMVRHRTLDRICAIKVIRDDRVHRKGDGSEVGTARFLGEVKALAKMQHHGIAVVFEYQDRPEEGYFYYAMEFCKGGNLQELVEKEGPLPWPVARWILLQVAEALKYAHGRRLLHRDIKPANIVLAEPWPEQQVKLIDFGILQVLDAVPADSSKAASTHGGQGVFNDTTASPEQLLSSTLDARSDLYSLGITLWWILLGANPFARQPRAQMISERLRSEYADDLPGNLDPEARAILLRLLAKNPDDRFADAQALIDGITGSLQKTASQVAALAAAPPPAPPAPVPTRTATPYDEAYSIPNPVSDLIVKTAEAAIYRVTDLASGERVAAITAQAGMSPETRAGFRAAAAAGEDFGSYRLLDWCSSANEEYFIASLPSGLSLLEILRKLGSARGRDAFALLASLAKSFDASMDRTTRGIRLELADIRVSSRSGKSDLQAISAWADIDPASIRSLPNFQSDGDTDAGGTLDISTAGPVNPVARFAALIYRLVSGGNPPYASYFTTSGYVMVSGLSEAGNQLLAKVLAGGGHDLRMAALVDRLSNLESVRKSSTCSTPSPASGPAAVAEAPVLPDALPLPPEAPAPSVAAGVVPPSTPPPAPVPARHPAGKRARPAWMMPAAIVLVALFAILWALGAAADQRRAEADRFEARRLKADEENTAQLKLLQERLARSEQERERQKEKDKENEKAKLAARPPAPAPEKVTPRVEAPMSLAAAKSRSHVLATRNTLLPARGHAHTVKSQAVLENADANINGAGQRRRSTLNYRENVAEKWEYIADNKVRRILQSKEVSSVYTVGGQNQDDPQQKDALLGIPVTVSLAGDKYLVSLESGKRPTDAQSGALKALSQHPVDHDFRMLTDTPRKIGDKWRVDPKLFWNIAGAGDFTGSFTVQFADVIEFQGVPCAVLKWAFDVVGKTSASDPGGSPMTVKLKGEATSIRSLPDKVNFESKVSSTMSMEGNPSPQVRLTIEGPYTVHQKVTVRKNP
jgi:tRNA A-37 threonylcarbamoyl transferase component Bud32